MKNKVLYFKSKAWAAPRNGGFTLMEILFVLLVIALIISFAVPAFRTVRFDVKNARAQAALKKLAEARHSFYQYSKGADVKGSFVGDGAKDLAKPEECTEGMPSGIPGKERASVEVGQLFACGFLNWKDFAGVPYTFQVCPLSGDTDCAVPGSLAVAQAQSAVAAGAKYVEVVKNNVTSPYYIYVGKDMQVKDNLE